MGGEVVHIVCPILQNLESFSETWSQFRRVARQVRCAFGDLQVRSTNAMKDEGLR
jgi:hypothetical protein